MVATTSPSERQDWLREAGIETTDAGKPYFKPSARAVTAKILAARPGDGQPRTLKNGGQVLILAVLDLEVEGVPHVWEVTSKRALAALRAIPNAIGKTVTIQTAGKGTGTTYLIEVYVPQPRVKMRVSKGPVTRELLEDGRVRVTDRSTNAPPIYRAPEPGEFE